jgi:hypothetical protein
MRTAALVTVALVGVFTPTMALAVTAEGPAVVDHDHDHDHEGTLIDGGAEVYDFETGEPMETSTGAGAFSDPGYTLMGNRYHNGEYTVRLVGDTEKYRTNVINAISNIHDHGLASMTLAPGTVAQAPETPPRGEIYIQHSTSACSVENWIACARPYGVWEDGAIKYISGHVWITPSISAHNLNEVILHEFGHVFGLHHYDAIFEGTRQVMHSITSDSSAWWFKSGDIAGVRYLNHPRPIGNLELVSTGVESVTVVGWLRDPLRKEPVSLHLYVDGVGKSNTLANIQRNDVGGPHGFNQTVSVGGGSHEVCAYAVSRLVTNLGCRTVTVKPNSPPIGSLEAVTTPTGQVHVSGWALDPDTTNPIDVHVYVGSNGTAHRADLPRTDVQKNYGMGEKHGFSVTVNAPAGTHNVCVYAINDRPGGNTLLRCQTVTVKNAMPIGTLEAVTVEQGGIRVVGWALDPDTTAPNDVHVYIGSTGTAYKADLPRSDVQRVHGLGENHGFSILSPAKPGTHDVCVYSINWPHGPNTLLKCQKVTVST